MTYAPVWLFIASLIVNVVLASSASSNLLWRWSDLVDEEELSNGTAFEHAIQLLGNDTDIPIALLQVIQNAVGFRKHAGQVYHHPHLRKGRRQVAPHSKHDQPHLLLQRSHHRGQERSGTEAETFDAALAGLNGQIEAAMARRDIEATRCIAMEQRHRKTVESMRHAVSDSSAQAASARGELMRAQMAASDATTRIPQLMESRRNMKAQCDEELSAMSGELQVALADAGEIGGVLKYSPCGASVAMLQLRDSRRSNFRGRRVGRGRARLVRHHAASLLASSGRKQGGKRSGHAPVKAFASAARSAAVKSDSTRQALDEVLRQLDDEAKSFGGAVSFAQLHHRTVRHRLRSSNETVHQAMKRLAKGAMNLNPTCEHMREKILRIMGAAVDKSEELRKGMAEVQQGCVDAERDFNSEIKNLEFINRDAQVRMAVLTAEGNQAEGQQRLNQDQLNSAVQGYQDAKDTCSKNLQGIQVEINDYQQLRENLDKLEGDDDPYFQDCMVSPWTHGECSVKCGGGGVQRLQRQVVTHPVRGAACPPLELQQDCGDDACPVDCQVGDWGGWSECSSNCGGGVQQRSRSVRLASSGGKSCGAMSDAQACNVQACDRDCELAHWTEWSKCSKKCGGGVQQRTRAVKLPPVGLGTCPSSTGYYRLGHRVCNAQPCGVQDSDVKPCEAELDLVLLIDGSGSLDSVSWYFMQQAGAELVKQLTEGKENARVAVLVFGGVPDSKCLSFGSEGAAATQDVNPTGDCGLQWLSHLSEPAATVAAQVPTRLTSLAQPAGSALLSEAFGAAEAELLHGREAAASAVAVLTAGKPVSAQRTKEAAAQLKTKARIVVMPVTKGKEPLWKLLKNKPRRGPWWRKRDWSRQVSKMREKLNREIQDMQSWSSSPLKSNYLTVPSFERLAAPETVHRLATEVCPVAAPA